MSHIEGSPAVSPPTKKVGLELKAAGKTHRQTAQGGQRSCLSDARAGRHGSGSGGGQQENPGGENKQTVLGALEEQEDAEGVNICIIKDLKAHKAQVKILRKAWGCLRV